MNERIRELALQAGLVRNGDFGMKRWEGPRSDSVSDQDLEKFAELIVRECAVYCEGHILPKGMAEENDLNYNDGVMDCAIGLLQHFGVEE